MPEWFLIIIVTAGCGGFIGIMGYFLKKFFDRFIDKQDTLINAINELTLILTRLDGKVELYKANSDRIDKDVDALEQDVTAINFRLINLEKEHAAKTARNDSHCG